MIKLLKMVLILLFSNSVLAANSLQVQWQEGRTSAGEISYIEFVLSTDTPIYGIQVDGKISKSWLKSIDTSESLYVPLLDGEFFGKSKPSTIAHHAEKQTGSFSYITSLMRPADAIENNAVIFSMPVKPVSGVLANISIDNVKVGFQDGTTALIQDIEIDSLSTEDVSYQLSFEKKILGIVFITLIFIALLGFKRKKVVLT